MTGLGAGCLLCGDDCSTDVTSTRTFDSAEPSLEGAPVSFCRNQKCLPGHLTSAQSVPGDSTLRCKFDVESASTCEVKPGVDGGFEAKLDYVLLPSDAEPKDDDLYSFDITAPTDSTRSLLHVEGHVTYASEESCGGCEHAEL